MPKYFTRIGLVAGASVLAAVLVAAPAHAAPATAALPDGDAMYSIDCSNIGVSPLQAYTVDAATATLTNLGTGSDIYGTECASSAAYNVLDGKSYYLGWGEPTKDFVAILDPQTGASTKVFDFAITPPAGLSTPHVTAFTIDRAGNGWIGYQAYDNAAQTSRFFFAGVDLTTGAVEDVSASVQINGLAVDPRDGSVWYNSHNGGVIGKVDTATGALTPVSSTAQFADRGDWAYGMNFDSSGRLWIIVEREVGSDYAQQLWSMETSDIVGTAQASGFTSRIIDGDSVYTYVETVLIAPTAAPAPAPVPVPVPVPAAVTPTLAETGVDASALAGVTGASGLALLLGAGLVFADRRRRARA